MNTLRDVLSFSSVYDETINSKWRIKFDFSKWPRLQVIKVYWPMKIVDISSCDYKTAENVLMLYNSAHIFRPNMGSGYVWRHANNTIPNMIYHPYGFVAFILEGFHKKTSKYQSSTWTKKCIFEVTWFTSLRGKRLKYSILNSTFKNHICCTIRTKRMCSSGVASGPGVCVPR